MVEGHTRLYRAEFGLEALAQVIKESEIVTTYGFELDGFRRPSYAKHWAQIGLLEQRRNAFLRQPSSPERTDQLNHLEVELSTLRQQTEGQDDARSVTVIDLRDRVGIVDFSAEDQVVTVRAGTRLWDLQQELAQKGQTLPCLTSAHSGLEFAVTYENLMVCHLIDFNLPHGLEGQCGSWRDWLLGAAIFRPDGSIARCGSRVVKNVAGYDIHKMIVGSRGTLTFPIEFVFRTFPVASLPKSEAKQHRTRTATETHALWIQRVQPTDFPNVLREEPDQILESDAATSTIWATVEPGTHRNRYPGDWVLRTGCAEDNVRITDRDQVEAMRQTKARLDPDDKFNPAEFGLEAGTA